jgi:hypothetical protein
MVVVVAFDMVVVVAFDMVVVVVYGGGRGVL